MSAIAMADVVARIRDLPSLPAVVLELLATMEQDNLDIDALGAKLALDQALSARVLRLANSSFYGMGSKVAGIGQAITVLGFHSVRTLVLSCSVIDSFPPGAAGGFDFAAFWRHALATAVCAKALARRLGVAPEAAFTAGLLHDIGTLVLATRYGPVYGAMLERRRERDCYVTEAEFDTFGLDHAEVGGALAAHWKFPAAIQAAVAGHHRAEAATPGSLALAVHAANIVAHALDLSGAEDDLVPPLPPAVWQTLALSEADSFTLFHDTETGFAAMCQMLVN